MRITAFASFVFTAFAVAALAVPTSYAGGWGWNRDAGAKARGEFGGVSSGTRTSATFRGSSGRDLYQTPFESRAGAACPQPAGQSFEAGDRVVMATENAELSVGHQPLGIIPKGTEFAVLQVEGPWLGASVMIGGQMRSGWVAAGAVSALSSTAAEPRLSTVSQQTVTPRPAAVSGGDCRIGRPQGTISPYDRDPYGLHEYNPSVSVVPAHEWDPNIHQWQPWLSE